MRVALAVHRLPPSVGGSEGYAGRLAQGLADRGHEVVVYTTTDPARPPLPYRVRDLRPVAVPGYPYIVWPDLLRPRLVREVAEADVLHAINFTSFSALAWLLIGRLYRRPLVLTTFYHPPPATGRPALAALYDRTAGRLIAGGYGVLLVHSDAESRELRGNVTVPPNARLRQLTCPPILDEVAPQGSFRRTHRLESKFVVLYIGRDNPHEGGWSLVRAATELRAEGTLPELALVLIGPVGQAPLRPAGLRLSTMLPNGTVHLVGPLPRSELAAAYAESDVVVVPSAYESYGLVVVEALGYGTPVISTRTGAATAFVRPGETGYLFDYGDVAELKRLLIATRMSGRQMRAVTRDAVAHLSWDRTSDETVAAYREVLACP
ncbi:MAG: glycosyltransferase family 4 protein [Chloroflexota bacterium]|nr:glycosyltransferase family 4 protein [Chloroflexota bacterium]